MIFLPLGPILKSCPGFGRDMTPRSKVGGSDEGGTNDLKEYDEEHFDFTLQDVELYMKGYASCK